MLRWDDEAWEASFRSSSEFWELSEFTIGDVNRYFLWKYENRRMENDVNRDSRYNFSANKKRHQDCRISDHCSPFTR